MAVSLCYVSLVPADLFFPVLIVVPCQMVCSQLLPLAYSWLYQLRRYFLYYIVIIDIMPIRCHHNGYHFTCRGNQIYCPCTVQNHIGDDLARKIIRFMDDELIDGGNGTSSLVNTQTACAAANMLFMSF